jgi:hypothetical protein
MPQSNAAENYYIEMLCLYEYLLEQDIDTNLDSKMLEAC